LLEDEDVRKVAKAADIKFVGIGGLVLAAARQNVVNREEALRLVNGLYAARRITSILRDALIAEFPRQ
jgi:predicted nucleic acid-binding protein